MKQTQQKRWLIDAALFTGFLICFFMNLTGVSLHQWLGIAAGLVALYHLVTHWDWVRAVTGRFFGKTSDQARAYYLVDAAALVGFILMIVTGLVISTWLSLSLANYAAWYAVHVLASIATLLFITLKIGLHARWIVSGWKKIKTGLTGDPLPAQRPTVLPNAERRSFLKLMGVVGSASVIALGTSMKALADSTGDPIQATSSTNTTASWPFGSSTSSSSSCVVACNRRCSYPGNCRRYRDTNGNNRCDYGECQS
jgi:hypothetical protein